MTTILCDMMTVRCELTVYEDSTTDSNVGTSRNENERTRRRTKMQPVVFPIPILPQHFVTAYAEEGLACINTIVNQDCSPDTTQDNTFSCYRSLPCVR